MTFEVPILFPSSVGAPDRYIVNDVNKTIRRIGGDSNFSQSPPAALKGAASTEFHTGAASMSSLKFDISGAKRFLSTCVLVDEPHILSVALSAGSNADSPRIVEFDLGSEIERFSNAIKIQAFMGFHGSQECIRLILVGENAVVLTMLLRAGDLAPLDTASSLGVLNIRDLLESEPAMKDATTGSQLHKTMVEFYSPSIMVLALSPLLMSVNLTDCTYHVWLETQCVEEMNARNTTFGNLFSRASDLILGRVEDGSLVDMAPTAALCVSSTANILLDSIFVFTMHSDGKIRKWLVDESSLTPLEVTSLDVAEIPNPRDWAAEYNSVYLSARLYEKVYALAVHIETDNSRESGEASKSHISVVYAYHGSPSAVSSKALCVPNHVGYLVDMSFLPSSHHCNLVALFRSSFTHGSTKMVQYSTSLVSIIGAEPKIEPINGFLDGTAEIERARIESLVMCDELEGVSSSSRTSLEDELHEMDSRFMKYLFRPAYPRGSGTILPPKNTHIHNALKKVAHGQIRYHGSDRASASIELETLRAMQDWRRRDVLSQSPPKARKLAIETDSNEILMSGRASATSVYDSYVAPSSIGEIEEEHSEGDIYEEANMDEKERSFLLDMHARRWRQLLLAIWEEEQALRTPLGLFLLDESTLGSKDEAVLVRAGVTSILMKHEAQPGSGDTLSQFDLFALKLINSLEADQESHRKLLALEQQIWRSVASAEQEATVPSDVSEGFARIVNFAFDCSRGGVFPAEDQKRIRQLLDELSQGDYYVLLQEMPRNHSQVRLDLACASEVEVSKETLSPKKLIASGQIRQAVCALATRHIDAGRRLLLARYLLASYVQPFFRLNSVAFYMYLRSLAALWTSSQQISTPTSFEKNSLSHSRGSSEPPNKRLSYGDTSLGDFIGSKTSCLDALLVRSLQGKNSGWTKPSALSVVVLLSGEILSEVLRSTVPTSSDIASVEFSRLLPELRALPRFKTKEKPEVATEYPRFALRLLTPLLALANPNESPNVTVARRETLAECLFVESQYQLHPRSKSRMRVRAFELLALDGIGLHDFKDAQAALEALQEHHLNSGMTDTVNVDKRVLIKEAQSLLYGEETEIRLGVQRLAQLESVQGLCAQSFGFGVTIPEKAKAPMKLLFRAFLHLANMMHRIEILEYHVREKNCSPDISLGFINDTIKQVNEVFPRGWCERMPEYLTLYKKLFDNALSAGDWNQAYDACVNNPSPDRRLCNFKVLVTRMVDEGALDDLVDRCSTLAFQDNRVEMNRVGSCVDLYAIATQTLEESCSSDSYLVRATSIHAASAAADYHGALYALHATRGLWRRAAMSHDFRFVEAMRALSKDLVGGQRQDPTVALSRERLIVSDIVLSSVGATVLCLVDDLTAQFIVSGEYEQRLHLPVLEIEERAPGTQRHWQAGIGPASKENITGLDRISQFLTPQHLRERAAWSIAFRKLCFDSSEDVSLVKSSMIQGCSPSFSRKALERLVRRGYYYTSLILAKAAKKGDCTEPQNDFYNCLSHLLASALVPLGVDGHISESNRPSIAQLCCALESVDDYPSIADEQRIVGWKAYNKGLYGSLQSLASALVQKLTCLHTNVEHPIALGVARHFLNYDEAIDELPVWLEQLLMGGNSRDSGSIGLFEGRSKPGCAGIYPGDPSALLTLYMQQGMLLKACGVVSSILSSDNNRNHRRLPEKGDIDYVPYHKIDALYALLEESICSMSSEIGYKEKLQGAQVKLVQVLESHFAQMKISEIGIRSARVLNRHISEENINS